MSTFVQLVVSGVALGAVYALVALGFVIIYRASGVFNFAQTELLTVGAFLMLFFSAGSSELPSAYTALAERAPGALETLLLAVTRLPWPIAFVAALATTGLVAVAIERVLLRRLVGRPIFVPIILTILVGALLNVGLRIFWGPEQYGMPTPWERTGRAEVFGASVYTSAVATVLIGALALVVYVGLSRKTRLGLGMRAIASDQEAALAVGVPVGRVLGVTWFLAGAFAAIGGVFLSMDPRFVSVDLSLIALSALPAVIVGGLTSPGGTVLAGFALGLLQLLAQGYINPRLGDFGQGFHLVFPYIVMILFLVIRPHGIFGEKDVERL